MPSAFRNWFAMAPVNTPRRAKPPLIVAKSRAVFGLSKVICWFLYLSWLFHGSGSRLRSLCVWKEADSWHACITTTCNIGDKIFGSCISLQIIPLCMELCRKFPGAVESWYNSREFQMLWEFKMESKAELRSDHSNQCGLVACCAHAYI
mgnify:CR=1 FL=1